MRVKRLQTAGTIPEQNRKRWENQRMVENAVSDWYQTYVNPMHKWTGPSPIEGSGILELLSPESAAALYSAARNITKAAEVPQKVKRARILTKTNPKKGALKAYIPNLQQAEPIQKAETSLSTIDKGTARRLVEANAKQSEKYGTHVPAEMQTIQRRVIEQYPNAYYNGPAEFQLPTLDFEPIYRRSPSVNIPDLYDGRVYRWAPNHDNIITAESIGAHNLADQFRNSWWQDIENLVNKIRK